MKIIIKQKLTCLKPEKGKNGCEKTSRILKGGYFEKILFYNFLA